MLLEELSHRDIWIGCISDFGEFWANRRLIEFNSEIVDSELRITLNLHEEDVSPGIGFAVNYTKNISTVIVLDREGTVIPTSTKRRKDKIYVFKLGDSWLGVV